MVAAEAGQQRADNLGARRQLAQSSLASGLLYPLLANLCQLCKKYGHVRTSHFAELEASLRARAEAEAVASLSAHG